MVMWTKSFISSAVLYLHLWWFFFYLKNERKTLLNSCNLTSSNLPLFTWKDPLDSWRSEGPKPTLPPAPAEKEALQVEMLLKPSIYLIVSRILDLRSIWLFLEFYLTDYFKNFSFSRIQPQSKLKASLQPSPGVRSGFSARHPQIQQLWRFSTGAS